MLLFQHEELKEVVESCREFDKENESCFKINLPYSVEMPDSSIITINNVDDRKKLKIGTKIIQRMRPDINSYIQFS